MLLQGTTITAFVSGTDGGVGTYTVSTSQTVTSETLNLTGSSALYGAAQAELNSSGQDPNAPANSDFIQFQAYSAVTINGSNGTSINAGAAFGPLFQITPNLSNYAPGATDQITEEAGSPNHTSAPLALEFVPNVGLGSGYSLAWNDIVTDSNGTHDQVEFAIYHPGATTPLVTQQTFQIPDNNPQSIRLLATTINGANVELLAYGDNTGTHVIEFDASGNKIASIFDPMNQTFSQFVNFGDGRIALVYDNPVDALGTTQYVTHIYDLRTTGLNINDSALADGKDKYIAGTQFSDAFTGENNVNNTYYYVGQNTTATGPTDNFTGGGWHGMERRDPARPSDGLYDHHKRRRRRNARLQRSGPCRNSERDQRPGACVHRRSIRAAIPAHSRRPAASSTSRLAARQRRTDYDRQRLGACIGGGDRRIPALLPSLARAARRSSSPLSISLATSLAFLRAIQPNHRSR